MLAIDYGGLGDCEGTPSEADLNREVRAVWNWAVEHGADPEDVVEAGLGQRTARNDIEHVRRAILSTALPHVSAETL